MLKKNIWMMAIMACLSLQAIAQVDRSKAPIASEAPKLTFGSPKSFTLDNGLKVYVITDKNNPKVSFSLSLNRGPIKEGDAAGYVDMVGPLMRAGTKNLSKEQLDEQIDFIGARVSVNSAGIFGSCLKKHQDKMLTLMSDILLNPSFPEEELEKMKTQAKSGLKASQNDAGAISDNIFSMFVYGKDHPYGEITTEASIDAISKKKIEKYYNKYFRPNIGYMAIIGNIKVGEAKKLTKKYFAQWEKKDVKKKEFTNPAGLEAPKVILVDKPGAVQSNITIVNGIDLKQGANDVLHATVMNTILGGGMSARLFQNLREDKAYTYGAYSSLDVDQLMGTFSASASVRTEVTDSAIVEFIKELKRIRETEVTDEELSMVKSQINGNFARSLERPQTMARFAINSAIYNYPENYYENYLTRLQNVTKKQVQDAAKAYVHPDKSYIIVVGNAMALRDKLTQFGDVLECDAFGKEITKSNVDVSKMTSESIIKRYLHAIGGTDKIKSVKSMKMVASGAIPIPQLQGAKMIRTQYVQGDKVREEQEMMGQKSITIFDGTKGYATAQGKTQELPEDQLGSLKGNKIAEEIDLLAKAADIKVLGAKKVDGKDLVMIEIKNGESASTRFYDVKTGLLTQVVMSTPQGEVIQKYSNYKVVDGIKFPHTMKVKMPQMPADIEFSVDTLEFNKDMDAELFKAK